MHLGRTTLRVLAGPPRRLGRGSAPPDTPAWRPDAPLRPCVALPAPSRAGSGGRHPFGSRVGSPRIPVGGSPNRWTGRGPESPATRTSRPPRCGWLPVVPGRPYSVMRSSRPSPSTSPWTDRRTTAFGGKNPAGSGSEARAPVIPGNWNWKVRSKSTSIGTSGRNTVDFLTFGLSS